MTNTSRAKQLLKLLKRLVKQEHLYTPEQIIEAKANIRTIQKEIDQLEAQTSKGFGKK